MSNYRTLIRERESLENAVNYYRMAKNVVSNGYVPFDAESAIEYLEDAIPCFIECEPVEMNYMEVSITCRNEDVAFVEKAVAPLV